MKPIHEELRELRLEKGVTLEDINTVTKISVEMLEKMEAGDFSLVPPPLIRAFLREYAEVTGIDPERVLLRYENKTAGIIETDPAVKTPGEDETPVKWGKGPAEMKTGRSREKRSDPVKWWRGDSLVPPENEKADDSPRPVRRTRKMQPDDESQPDLFGAVSPGADDTPAGTNPGATELSETKSPKRRHIILISDAADHEKPGTDELSPPEGEQSTGDMTDEPAPERLEPVQRKHLDIEDPETASPLFVTFFVILIIIAAVIIVIAKECGSGAG